ncbi:MAG: hypothetical protein AAFY20_20205 [Cyanobacteria bacterium J06639_14]
MEKDIIIALGWCKRLIQRLLGLIALLIDELPAHLVRRSDVTDGLRAREHLDADVLANVRG